MPSITFDLAAAAELAETLPCSPNGYPAATSKPSPAASPPSSATPPTAPALSARICTGSPSSSAPATEELFGEPTP